MSVKALCEPSKGTQSPHISPETSRRLITERFRNLGEQLLYARISFESFQTRSRTPEHKLGDDAQHFVRCRAVELWCAFVEPLSSSQAPRRKRQPNQAPLCRRRTATNIPWRGQTHTRRRAVGEALVFLACVPRTLSLWRSKNLTQIDRSHSFSFGTSLASPHKPAAVRLVASASASCKERLKTEISAKAF